MFKLKELFRINYKNKNIIILLDNQNKKVFLEEKEDGALVCPPIGIFIELYKIYNIKDETLYETKKEKLIKNKSIKRSILEIVKIYAIVIPLTLSSIKINDMFTRENYVYSEQYKILNELYPKKVTKEDVIEVINNNPNLTEEYKKIAKDQLEEFLIKDPAMNLRIYYENMKDIIVDDNVPELLMSLHGEYVVGYYSARDNKIGLLSGVDDKTKMHEFAHAGHCFFLEIGEKVIIINDFSGRSLSEAMNNKMISVTDQEPHSYHNEAYLLDFFMENVDNYNVHSYTEYGIQSLIDELKEKYPEVNVNYLTEFIDARKITTIKLGIQKDYIEEKKLLDELFKITLSNIDKENYYSSFDSFAKLLEKFGLYAGKESKAATLKKQYLKEYIDYIGKKEYSLQDKSLHDLNSIIYINNSFYIGGDDFYLDYNGKKVNCNSNASKMKIGGPLEYYFLKSLEEKRKIYSEENVKEILLKLPIVSLFKIDSNEQLLDEEVVNLLNDLYDFYINKNYKTYHDLNSNYKRQFVIAEESVGKALLKQNRSVKNILKEKNIDYNMKLQDTAKELNLLTEENKQEELACNISCIIEIDNKFYPCVNYPYYTSINIPEIPHFYDGGSAKFTDILDNGPIIFYSYDEDYNLEYHSVSNKVVNIYSAGSKDGISVLSQYLKNHPKEHLDQESIKNILYDNDLLGKDNYKNAFKLKDGTFITDKELDNSFYIEFGIKTDGNITYRIKEGDKVIYEPEKGANYRAQISYKSFLDGMDIKILDNIEKNLEETRLKRALVNFENYFDNMKLYSEKLSTKKGYSIPAYTLEGTPTITFEDYKKVILDGKKYNAKEILIDYNPRKQELNIFFPDGTFYPVNLLITSTINRYSHHLDYYLEKYTVPTSKTYEISLEDLVNLVRKDFEETIKNNNLPQFNEFVSKKTARRQ